MPPNLDPIARKTSRLNQLCPASLLDALPGVAGLLDTGAKWTGLSRYWDRLMSRANRPEWSRDALLDQSLYALFPDSKQQTQLKRVFASLAEGKLEQHAQTVEFGTGARALHVEMVFRPLAINGAFAGVLVQLLDATRDHMNRMALLDRERRLRDLQERTEVQTTEYTESMARRTLEHSREMASLHEEIERLTTEQSAQIAQTRDTYQAAMRKLGEKPGKQVREFAEMVAEMAEKFREHPSEFCRSVARLFKEMSGCYFTTVYRRTPDKQGFVICSHCDAPETLALHAEQGYIKLAEGEGTCGHAATQGEPMKFAHLAESADYAPWAHIAKENGYNCLWAIPMRLNGETCGVVQLYYHEEDAPLSADQQMMYSTLAQAAAPLLMASQELAAPPSTNGAVPAVISTDWRQVIGGLAEQYGNLLTGVLGHATLAAAEVGDTHAARDDLRAIERAARSAAKLTRRLAALSGSKDKTSVLELGAYVQKYLERHRLSPNGKGEAVLPVAPCEVRVDVTALDVIFDGIMEYARQNAMAEGAPLWTLIREDGTAHLTLLFDASPNGRSEDAKKRRREDQDPSTAAPSTNGVGHFPESIDLMLSREAARAWGGEIEINRADGQTAMVLTLPVEEKLET